LDRVRGGTLWAQTPGVYINEISAFPNSVVPVATAVPAFVGYTMTAEGEDEEA
jgi:phage tail sheath protein FI